MITMSRFCAFYLLLGTLIPMAGCEVLSRDSLAPALSGQASAPTAPAKNLELPPDAAAEACFATAQSLAKAGQDTEAIALYEKARQAGVHQHEISRRLAVLYDRQGDFNKAAEEYKPLLQKNPKDADLLNDFGYSCYSQGKWSDAETQFRQAVNVNPKHARAWVNLGMTLAQLHRTQESIEAFSKVVSAAQAHCNVAFILTTQGRFDDAKAAYRKALALDPELTLARAALAKLENPAPRPGQPSVTSHGGGEDTSLGTVTRTSLTKPMTGQ
jgi:Tfp pilus assembly protein PilF